MIYFRPLLYIFRGARQAPSLDHRRRPGLAWQSEVHPSPLNVSGALPLKQSGRVSIVEKVDGGDLRVVSLSEKPHFLELLRQQVSTPTEAEALDDTLTVPEREFLKAQIEEAKKIRKQSAMPDPL